MKIILSMDFKELAAKFKTKQKSKRISVLNTGARSSLRNCWDFQKQQRYLFELSYLFLNVSLLLPVIFLRDHSFNLYAKYFEKLAFLTSCIREWEMLVFSENFAYVLNVWFVTEMSFSYDISVYNCRHAYWLLTSSSKFFHVIRTHNLVRTNTQPLSQISYGQEHSTI